MARGKGHAWSRPDEFKVVLVPDREALARVGARMVVEWLGASDPATVIPAMGNTPQQLYLELARLHREDAFHTGNLVAIQLDEYADVSETDPRSLFGWLDRSFARPLGIPRPRIIGLNGGSVDWQSACRAYDRSVAAVLGVRVAILGLGHNGHLGFNEPPSGPDAPTRLVRLAPESIISNAKYWPGYDQLPTQALTSGMPWLLGATHRLLVVSGREKRAILRRVLTEPVDPVLPASHLRSVPGSVLLADHAAWPPDMSAPEVTA